MLARIRQRVANRRRTLIRTGAMLTAVAASSLGLVAATTTSASAQTCNGYGYNGHVYLINPSGYGGTFIKWDYDALDGPTYDFHYQAGATVSFQLGGNNLTPGVGAPYWQVFDQNGAFIGTKQGNNTGSNCVSNQKYFTDSGSLGDVHTFKANYQGGNTGTNVYQQAHFRFIFDQPPPLPDPDPDPDPCQVRYICFNLL